MATILVIEDQAFQRAICRDLLEEEGHQVIAVERGNEALRLAPTTSFDVALVDIYLEGESGLEVCRRLSLQQPDTPVIIMTGSPSVEAAVQSMRMGAYDFLVKPLNRDMVLISVRRALERTRLVREKNDLIRQLTDSNRVLKSFQAITLATISAQRPRTLFLKALHGMVDVTRSAGGTVLLEAQSLKFARPLVHRADPHVADLSRKDRRALLEFFKTGTDSLLLPAAEGTPRPTGIEFSGPLAAFSFALGKDAAGGVVLWKSPQDSPFRAGDLSVISGILSTLGYFLNARIRQRSLQTANRRLTLRVERSTSRMREIRSRLQQLVIEVEEEKTRRSEALDRLNVIHRIGREFGSFVDVDQHIKNVINLCQQALRARTISLLLRDPESENLYIKYAVGLPEQVTATARINPGEGISGWVFKRGEPLLIRDVENDTRFRRVSRLDQYDTTSLISAPVRVKGKPYGVLNVNNKLDGSLFTPEDLDLLVFVSHEVGVAIENTSLYDDIQNSYFETIRSLVRVLEAKDKTTKGHSERVTAYCLTVGKSMKLSPHSLEVLKRAAILHDLGKVVVDLSILRKKGKLSEEEYLLIKDHPKVAAEIIKPMRYMEDVQRCIRQHHERADGNGYPLGTQDICLEACILAVADAYDAMTSWRPYRRALPTQEAVKELRRCAGSQFDPMVVDVFTSLLEQGDLPRQQAVEGF